MHEPRMIELVTRYLDGLGRKDLSQAPLADDVSFQGPTTSLLIGKEAVVAYLTSTFPLVLGVVVHGHTAQDNRVVTAFDFVTTRGTIPVLESFVIEGQRIRQMRPYFDPRPLLSAP